MFTKMNILDQIIENKFREVASRKAELPVSELEKFPGYSRQTLSLRDSLLRKGSTGIIAEFKRKSPSKGILHPDADVESITRAYTLNGAAGMSVLTDSEFFGALPEDFSRARINEIPILRKDFIIDEYQLVESRAMGADVVLLIAANLTPERVCQLAQAAVELKLEVLLELHDETELDHLCDEVTMVGINNRDLKTFIVDIQRSIDLCARIPDKFLKIAESGIQDTATILRLREEGFSGFLVGERFMKQPNTEEAFMNFVQDLKGR
jgi:indole-3-glycerol phosphate synthase